MCVYICLSVCPYVCFYMHISVQGPSVNASLGVTCFYTTCLTSSPMILNKHLQRT